MRTRHPDDLDGATHDELRAAYREVWAENMQLRRLAERAIDGRCEHYPRPGRPRRVVDSTRVD